MPDRLSLPERIERDFIYHPPTEDKKLRLLNVRLAAKAFAYAIADLTPESREQSLAITHLEEAVFWANAAIARNP